MQHPLPEKITSLKNPKIRNFQHLNKARERRSQGLFVVEGVKEVLRALSGGYVFTHLFYCPEILGPGQLEKIQQQAEEDVAWIQLDREVYNHVVYRKDAEGIVGWSGIRSNALKNISLGDPPLVLVLEQIEKPGNLGAILRTADAASLDAVIIADPQTDIYNPNVVRSSLGALFTVQVGIASSGEVLSWLQESGISIYCTALTASKDYADVDFTGPTAIVMGTEATGLSDLWLGAADHNILIPMNGTVDSMNVSVSAGVVIFEALRQRRKGL